MTKTKLPVMRECEYSRQRDTVTGYCSANCPYFKNRVTKVKKDDFLLSPGTGHGYKIVCGTNGYREIKSFRELPSAIFEELRNLLNLSKGLTRKLIPQ